MKTLIKIGLLAGIAIYLVVALFMNNGGNDGRCRGLKLSVRQGDEGLAVVDSAMIKQLLDDAGVAIDGERMSNIDLMVIDSLINANPYVSKCSCFKASSEYLQVEVEVTGPVMRVIPDRGDSYYISADGDSLPIMGRQFDLPVATGCMTAGWASLYLPRLYSQMRADAFVADLIEQISVACDSTVTIVPVVGNHLIRLGKVELLDDKFSRLRQFYREAMPNVGWEKYSEISLEYENQIVCTKKKVKKK